MFMRGLPAIAATVALIAAPATASAKESYRIGFEKDCPELTCTGTLLKRSGAPIPGSFVATTLTPLWFESDMLGYSALETFSRGDSAFTMNLVGTVDYSAEPDATDPSGLDVQPIADLAAVAVESAADVSPAEATPLETTEPAAETTEPAAETTETTETTEPAAETTEPAAEA